MRRVVYTFLKATVLLMPIAYLMFVIMVDMAYGIVVFYDVGEVARLVYLPIPLLLSLSLIPFLYTVMNSFRLLIIFEQKEKMNYRHLYLYNIQKGTFYYAIIITLSLPFVYLFVEVDDSPGFLLLFIIFALTGYVLSAFAYVLKEQVYENNL